MKYNEWSPVRILSESESGQILELLNFIQPHIPWSKEYLRWQYFESPAGRARLYGISDSQDKLIAFYAAVPHRARIGNQLITARMIQDVMTHPDYRGRGFLHQLGERCFRDIIESGEVGYTFPNEKSEKSFRRIGWTELYGVPWRKKDLSLKQPTPNLEVTEVRDYFRDDSVSSIWKSSGLSVGVNRDAAYLNWRYSKPAAKYFKFSINGTEGLIILKLYGNTLHICELLTRHDKLRNISPMLEFCDSFAVQHGATKITAWLHGDHPYGAPFDQHGLELVTGTARYVFIHPGGDSNEVVMNPNLWHITQGDSDIY